MWPCAAILYACEEVLLYTCFCSNLLGFARLVTAAILQTQGRDMTQVMDTMLQQSKD
jgi:hypothetical protein